MADLISNALPVSEPGHRIRTKAASFHAGGGNAPTTAMLLRKRLAESPPNQQSRTGAPVDPVRDPGEPQKGKKDSGRQPEIAGSSPGDESEVMTLREVAAYLNCHYSTAFRLVHSGDFPAFRVGGDWRFRRVDLDKWIADRQVRPSGNIEGKPPDRRGRHKRG
jgi:excisionase family DNA binding protein